jgi:hypothetical protein
VRQRLVAYITLLSTLLLPLAAVMWGRSYLYNDTIYRVGDGYGVVVDTIRGEVSVWFGPVDRRVTQRGRDSFRAEEGITARELLARQSGAFDLWLAGFGYAETRTLPSGFGPATRGQVVRAVVVPYWFVFLLVAVLPGRVLVGHLRTRERLRRESAGRCRRCRYDLRPGYTRCPDCGEPVATDTSGSLVA